ncbi:MAG: hypothetical protein ACRYFS_02585 [Janthinobacterium lividum]
MKNICRSVSISALMISALPVWADTPTVPPATSPAMPVLDKLVGKHKVIGLTERGGSRYLGRVLSGDHGLYVFQSFHYIGAPQTTLQTTTVTGYRRRSQKTTRVTTQTTVADDVAVQALVSGVTGSTYRPREEAAGRELVAASDVVCIQELSPPFKSKAAVPAASVASTVPTAPAVSTKWTLKTLWASPDLPAPTVNAVKNPAKQTP